MTRTRLIAIGDIHGCSRALATLLAAIEPRPEDVVVPLGDVVDRGPDSRGVVEQLLALRRTCHVIPLMGNHEEMLLASLASTVERRAWIASGGSPTLDSYGFGGGLEMIPDEHIQFIKGFRPYYETDEHILLHANYVPDLPLAEQPPRALRWEFFHRRIPKPHFSGKTVIVGHSAQESGEILDLGYVKCIETDCVAGGWLTGLDVNSGRIWQANQKGKVRA